MAASLRHRIPDGASRTGHRGRALQTGHRGRGIASPLVVSTIIGADGSNAMVIFIAAADVALVGFGIRRMRARPTRTDRTDRTAYGTVPLTSFLIRHFGRRRDDG